MWDEEETAGRKTLKPARAGEKDSVWLSFQFPKEPVPRKGIHLAYQSGTQSLAPGWVTSLLQRNLWEE